MLKSWQRSGLIWFCVAAVGQAAFVWMILAHFGRRTLIGDFAGWIYEAK